MLETRPRSSWPESKNNWIWRSLKWQEQLLWSGVVSTNTAIDWKVSANQAAKSAIRTEIARGSISEFYDSSLHYPTNFKCWWFFCLGWSQLGTKSHLGLNETQDFTGLLLLRVCHKHTLKLKCSPLIYVGDQQGLLQSVAGNYLSLLETMRSVGATRSPASEVHGRFFPTGSLCWGSSWTAF